MQTADTFSLFVSTIMETFPPVRLTLGVSLINHTSIGVGVGVGVLGQVMGQVVGQVVLDEFGSKERWAAHIIY